MEHLLAAAGPEEIKNMAGLKALMIIPGGLYFPKEHNSTLSHCWPGGRRDS